MVRKSQKALAMPRYFFSLSDGCVITDQEGEELPGIAAARDEAIRMAGRILRNEGQRALRGTEWCMEVFDDTRQLVFRLSVSGEDIDLDRSQPDPHYDKAVMELGPHHG
jgi:hypothetical protein